MTNQLMTWPNWMTFDPRTMGARLPYLSPLNSCFDFSSRWQNSRTIFLSCSSMLVAMLATMVSFCYMFADSSLLHREPHCLTDVGPTAKNRIVFNMEADASATTLTSPCNCSSAPSLDCNSPPQPVICPAIIALF